MMRRPSRGAVAAQRLLEENSVTALPVNVRTLARKFASILHDPLPGDVSGMLVPNPDGSKKWVIVLNKSHTQERQRFTLAHELGHILLHQYTSPHADGAQRVRFRDSQSATGTDREEVEANQFAAELLMPRELMLSKLRDLGIDAWDSERATAVSSAIAKLARECQVSEQALLFRIANLMEA